ncbi:MFS transporter, OHS family, lactose permease [Pseudoduganella namucuonensis]|uniref:MFS transporter, OHS family, lactose permease n=1 Tax=Pseudoduganella namucuonensis TaxID=1035707 RepID=A0A1I7LH96_9BURK|nr:MFS transporter, OHS family, lactose permease [Pseudoduganella namucuonensis]
MTSRQSQYAFLCTYMFGYFFAQAMSVSLLALWLRSTLQLNGTETGIVFSANFTAAMCSQPVYGYLSDKAGMRKHILWVVAILVMLSGPFLVHVYSPLLKTHLLPGAALGGVYLGITFIAGGYAVESYVDRVGRACGFEYSRVRMFGSLGFASAVCFSGRLFSIDPNINFYLGSAAGLALVALMLMWRIPAPAAALGPAARVGIADALGVLRDRHFWRFMLFVLSVTNVYLVFDQQFPSYFASLFPTREEGAAMYGYLNSVQIFLEAGGLFLAPLLVRRIGAKNGLLLAGAIMLIRIAGSSLAVGPLSISCMRLLHSVEVPIILVSVFRYIACHFDHRLASTVYMVGWSFGHSIGLALLSPMVGKCYDLFGFQRVYLLLAALGLVFLILSAWGLEDTPAERSDAGAPLASHPCVEDRRDTSL